MWKIVEEMPEVRRAVEIGHVLDATDGGRRREISKLA